MRRNEVLMLAEDRQASSSDAAIVASLLWIVESDSLIDGSLAPRHGAK